MFPIEDGIDPQRLVSPKDSIDRLARFPVEVGVGPKRFLIYRPNR